MSKKIPIILCHTNILSGVTSWGFTLKKAFENHPRYDVLLAKLWNATPPSDKYDFNLENANEIHDLFQALSPAIVIPNYNWQIFHQLDNENLRFLGMCHSDTEREYYEPLAIFEPYFSKFIGVSPTCTSKLGSFIPDRQSDISTMPYGIEVPPYLNRTYQNAPIRLVYGGRIVHEQKRVFDFIPLVSELTKLNVDFIFDIVGEGDDLDVLKNEMLAQFPTAKVNFLGAQPAENMAQIWRDHDIFIQVSDYEGTSISMIEAMAQGVVPVVTEASSGVSSVISNGVNGKIVEVSDMQAMAFAVQELAKNKSRLSNMGTLAYENSKQFDLKIYVDKFTEILDEIARTFDYTSQPIQPAANTSDKDKIMIEQNGPWTKLPLSRNQISSSKSMMTDEEVAYIYWLAKSKFKGVGVIVDTGCLQGTSTVAMAQGIRANSNLIEAENLIYAYDLFIYEDYMKDLDISDSIQVGDSLVPYFEKNVSDFKNIRTIAGDLCAQEWHGLPIEILFVDASKTWDLNNHTIEQFFPFLMAGTSHVIHQDYYWYGVHWIHVTMEYLSDYFEQVHAIQNNSAGFKLIKAIPQNLLSLDFETYLDSSTKIKLMDQAINKQTSHHQYMLKVAKVGLLIEIGYLDEADELINNLESSEYKDFYPLQLAITFAKADLESARSAPAIENRPKSIPPSSAPSISEAALDVSDPIKEKQEKVLEIPEAASPAFETKRATARKSTVDAIKLIKLYYKHKIPDSGSAELPDLKFIWSQIENESPNCFVELGVASGLSTALTLDALHSVNPDATLIAIDIMENWYFDMQHKTGFVVDEIQEINKPKYEMHREKWAADFEDILNGRSIDMIFIDANHNHPWALIDTVLALPYLNSNSLIIYHDINLYKSERYADGISPHHMVSLVKDEIIHVPEEEPYKNIAAIRFTQPLAYYESSFLEIMRKEWTAENPIPHSFIDRILAVVKKHYSADFYNQFSEIMHERNHQLTQNEHILQPS